MGAGCPILTMKIKSEYFYAPKMANYTDGGEVAGMKKYSRRE
jgi:hypothetical protein